MELDNVGKWMPVVKRRAFSPRVLVVSTTRIEGAWCAYIGAVPGKNHDAEQEEVLLRGSKLPEAVAKAMFPWQTLPYAP